MLNKSFSMSSLALFSRCSSFLEVHFFFYFFFGAGGVGGGVGRYFPKGICGIKASRAPGLAGFSALALSVSVDRED